MSFRDLLEDMHRKDASIRGGAISGLDGLTVEEWQVPPSGYDVPALCAEMAQFFKEADRIAGENGLGGSSELLLASEEGLLVVRKVTEDYLLLLIAEPGAVPGRCRFHLRNGARRAREML